MFKNWEHATLTNILNGHEDKALNVILNDLKEDADNPEAII